MLSLSPGEGKRAEAEATWQLFSRGRKSVQGPRAQGSGPQGRSVQLLSIEIWGDLLVSIIAAEGLPVHSDAADPNLALEED